MFKTTGELRPPPSTHTRTIQLRWEYSKNWDTTQQFRCVVLNIHIRT